MKSIKCLIVGGGPAGYTAAIYAARAALDPVLIEGPQPGGQLTTTTVIENFPGFPNGVDANTLMADMREQAVRLGTQIISGTVVSTDLSARPFKLVLDPYATYNGAPIQPATAALQDAAATQAAVLQATAAQPATAAAPATAGPTVFADSLIIATGASAKYLGLPSEEKFKGAGVSACATCDGFFYRRKDVAVVGGGDTACEEALYLSSLCNKVYMIVRRDVLRASVAMQNKVMETPNIEILWNCNTSEVLGDSAGVTGVRLLRKDGGIFDIKVDGFFLAIGHHPNSEAFSPWVKTDENGYILTQAPGTQTSVEGVFAAGDVQDPCYRQAINAAAAGCRAALDAEKYLKR